MKNAIIFALLFALAILAFGTRDEAQAVIEDTTLLHHADFPLCVTIKTAPLLRTPTGKADFRLGKPSNDRGDT